MTTKTENGTFLQVIADSRVQIDQLFGQILDAIGHLSQHMADHLTAVPRHDQDDTPNQYAALRRKAKKKAKKAAKKIVIPPASKAPTDTESFTLMDYVVKALAVAAKPLTTRELFDQLQADGWQSESAKPISVLTIGLRSEIKKRGKKSRIVRDVEQGTYRLASVKE